MALLVSGRANVAVETALSCKLFECFGFLVGEGCDSFTKLTGDFDTSSCLRLCDFDRLTGVADARDVKTSTDMIVDRGPCDGLNLCRLRKCLSDGDVRGAQVRRQLRHR